MKEMSKETIEIGGKEYSLFLNREGIVAWERFCNDISKSLQDNAKEINDILNTNKKIEEKDDTNPFEDNDVKNIVRISEENENLTSETYKKLYWIMLYTEHKLSKKETDVLYDKACEEYGVEQVNALADQMMVDANRNKLEKKTPKKLPALRPQV